MRDFLGNEISVGNWLAYPGGGNKVNEHGLILLWVTRVTNSRVYVQRLSSRDTFDRSTFQRAPKATVVSTYICNTQKCAVIEPSDKLKMLFALTAANELDFNQQHLIAYWLKGKSPGLF